MALYPPIVASAMPAFAGNEVRIYFSLSGYNSINEVSAVHASVRRQSSNVNVLNSIYQVKSYGFYADEDVLNRYYIIIPSEDIVDGFEIDVLYKVQLRLSSINFEEDTPPAGFFTDNINNFSEWSTVCIIKKINAPNFYIDEFTTEDEKEDSSTDSVDLSINTYYNSLADFNLVYESFYINKEGSKIQSEPLNKYSLQLFDDKNNLLVNSGVLLSSAYNYTANTNSVIISCYLPYQLKNNNSYNLKVTIETRNGYIESKIYPFDVELDSYDGLNAELSAAVNEEEGYIKLKAVINEDPVYTGNLVIRRSDSKGHFLNWKDIKHYKADGTYGQEIIYYDFTVQSGTIYKYLIQKRDIRGRRGTPVYVTYLKTEVGENDQVITTREQVEGIMGEWNHAFLLQSNNGNLEETKQLKMQFDFQLSTYKFNILESKTDTLGSKYPFIRRNGDMYYRSFGCSGTITGFMDQADLFTSKNQLYDGYTNFYEEFKGQINHYTTTYDYTYERKFREKVEQFLYNSKPKLYKSTQEGNMIIKLMDVSLTPKTELGRLIYTFSATAYEIDDGDVQSLINYNFIQPGNYDVELEIDTDTIGRLTGYRDKTSYEDLDNLILNKFEAGFNILGTDSQGHGAGSTSAAGSIAQAIQYDQSFNGKIVNNFKIDWLRITIEDDPYLIIKRNGVYEPLENSSFNSSEIENIDNESILYFFKQRPKQSQVYIGTLMYLNGKPIIISPPNNIYEISDIILTQNDSISFAKDTAAIIDYHIEYSSIEDVNNNPSKKRVDRVNGCLEGMYQNLDVIKLLTTKYRFSNKNNRSQSETRVEKFLQGVKTILIDTQPGTIVSIETNAVQNNTADFVVGFTGELKIDFIDEQDTYITSFIIQGQNNKPVEALVYYCAAVGREYY